MLQRESLVIAYRHLCPRAARKFARPGLERCDLEQVAAIGLLKAADRYDPALGTPFEAYAWVLVLGEISHFVRDHERLVRLPRGLRRQQKRLEAERERLRAELGRAPRDTELAQSLNLPLATLSRVRRAGEAAKPLRLDDANDAAARRIAARIAVRNGTDDRLLIDTALAALPDLERRVIVGVYLLGLRQLEVARRLKMSAKAISRLHGVALARMQGLCADALAS
jgi:RNA polymerase sigma-B factor